MAMGGFDVRIAADWSVIRLSHYAKTTVLRRVPMERHAHFSIPIVSVKPDVSASRRLF